MDLLRIRLLPDFRVPWVYLFYLMAGLLTGLLILCLLILDSQPYPDKTVQANPDYPGATPGLPRPLVQPDNPMAGEKRLIMSARDIETVVALLMARRQTGGHIRCRAQTPRLSCEASLRPLATLPLFINVSLLLDRDAGPDERLRVSLGRLAFFVGRIANLLRPLASLAGYGQYLRLWEQRVIDWRIQDDRLEVSVIWKNEWFDPAQNWIEDWVSRERFLIYDRLLSKTLAASRHIRFVRLGYLMHVLFGLARDRSPSDAVAIAENTAVIRVLNAYVNGGLQEATPGRLQVLLNGRVDTAQHFLASAALALAMNSELSHLMGVAKELNDTHGGSGFSFVDLAADRSGIVFARLATATGTSARMIQTLLSLDSDEARFMVDTRNLPEHREAANPADPEYQALETLIENRVAALAIHGKR